MSLIMKTLRNIIALGTVLNTTVVEQICELYTVEQRLKENQTFL